jgi:hypothetical protein
VREIFETAGTLRSPAWNPSGEELIVARGQVGRSEILAVDAETGNPRVLLESRTNETLGQALPSPDGKALLVSVMLDGEPALRVVPAVGGKATVELVNADEGTWVDDDTVVFSRQEGGSGPGLYSYSLSRREATRVRGGEDQAWCRAVPRPGGGFALLAGPASMPDSLYVAGEIGSAPQRWLAPGNEIFGVDWTPHGRSLVASMDGRLMRVDAEGATPIIPRLDRLWYPAFSSEGGRLAAVRRSSTNDLISVDPDGGGWSCLLCGVPDSGWGSVDGDGVVVYR